MEFSVDLATIAISYSNNVQNKSPQYQIPGGHKFQIVVLEENGEDKMVRESN